MYNDGTEFGRSLKPNTKTPIFGLQRIQENYFQLREKPRNGTFGKGGISLVMVKVGCAIPQSNGLCTYTTFVKSIFNIIVNHMSSVPQNVNILGGS